MKQLLVVGLLLGTNAARADSVAYTCSASENVKPLTDRGACIGFIAYDAQKREVQRVDKGYLISGSILATPDGKTVAMLHHFPYTTKPFATLPGLIFFRDGKEVATYSMTDLVKRMDLVTHSVSHVHWVARDASPSRVLGKTFELVTTSQRKYTFDVSTGKQLSADDTDDWKQCDMIIYLAETVPPPTNGYHLLAKPWFAKGSLASRPIAVKAAPGVRIDSGTTICVRPSTAGWLASKNIDVMFNALPK